MFRSGEKIAQLINQMRLTVAPQPLRSRDRQTYDFRTGAGDGHHCRSHWILIIFPVVKALAGAAGESLLVQRTSQIHQEPRDFRQVFLGR